MPTKHSYSRYSLKAAQLLGVMIKLKRKELKFTSHDLADRAGISRTTLRRIENGDMACEIGLVFEVATILGLKLFDADSAAIDAQRQRIEDKLVLLPKSVRASKIGLHDDF